jgi:O-methyltransferase involved in polyketide biosynthesis
MGLAWTESRGGVHPTVFYSVWARAEESRCPNPLLFDSQACRIASAWHWDPPSSSSFVHRMARSVLCATSRLIDEAVIRFLADSPDGLVVNLGAGLCTRFYRLDNGRVHWLEIDLPSVEPFWRENFKQTERHQFLGASVEGEAWIREVAKLALGRPVLFIAEGLFPFLAPSVGAQILSRLASEYPAAELLATDLNPWSFFWARMAMRWVDLSSCGLHASEGWVDVKLLERWSPDELPIDVPEPFLRAASGLSTLRMRLGTGLS